ncbi:zinc-ribbon domain containing protein [Pectinatus sottacetonis]|uniref:zinc-ribbon domain containing protein n=1 Tax=Pectinatus sottacetonis TaxID=1002795 RepID=UPI0018C787EB|nr:zinc-ribbon domain containing protein [Pectinatus sottacetonis]
MDYQDKTLICKECGKEFVFTAGEQAFYAEKGFENEPGRCHECRGVKKRSRGAQTDRKMYDVICAKCGKKTQVPFEPKLNRPIYCRDCFNALRNKSE